MDICRTITIIINMSIIIRHSEQADIPAIKRLYEQPSCFANTLRLPYSSKDSWQKRFGDLADNFYSLVAEMDDEIVGQITLEVNTRQRRKHVATLGMAVSEKHRGNGIGSKLLYAVIDLAEKWMAVTRIELEVYTDNEGAIGLYKKFGFEIEGTARKYAFRDGEYIDAYLMARVKP
jgi:putative acetyltransferase